MLDERVCRVMIINRYEFSLRIGYINSINSRIPCILRDRPASGISAHQFRVRHTVTSFLFGTYLHTAYTYTFLHICARIRTRKHYITRHIRELYTRVCYLWLKADRIRVYFKISWLSQSPFKIEMQFIKIMRLKNLTVYHINTFKLFAYWFINSNS